MWSSHVVVSGILACMREQELSCPHPLHASSRQIFTERYKKGYWDIRAFVAPGGTPSSHSSLCSVRQILHPPYLC